MTHHCIYTHCQLYCICQHLYDWPRLDISTTRGPEVSERHPRPPGPYGGTNGYTHPGQRPRTTHREGPARHVEIQRYIQSRWDNCPTVNEITIEINDVRELLSLVNESGTLWKNENLNMSWAKSYRIIFGKGWMFRMQEFVDCFKNEFLVLKAFHFFQQRIIQKTHCLFGISWMNLVLESSTAGNPTSGWFHFTSLPMNAATPCYFQFRYDAVQ